MNRDKKILYSISIFLFVMLSLVFFIPTNSTKIIVAALLIAYAIIHTKYLYLSNLSNSNHKYIG